MKMRIILLLMLLLSISSNVKDYYVKEEFKKILKQLSIKNNILNKKKCVNLLME